MKLGLISDTHATIPTLDAVLDALADEGVDRVVCLGDIVDLGPQPNEVCERLRERRIPCIRGNHDRLDEGPPHEGLALVEAWTRDRLTPEHRAWLWDLPEQRWEELGGAKIWCVHGSPDGQTDGITPETPTESFARWEAERPWDVLVCGHTHVQLVRRHDARTIVNVGSTAQPFERAFAVPPRALPFCDYAVLDVVDGAVGVHLRRVRAPMDAVRRAYRANGFPDPERWLSIWG